MPTGAWHGFGVAVTGVSHERAGLPCQDAFALYWPAADTVIAGVADGAGSASRSAQGSRVAVDGAVASLAAAYTADPHMDRQGWREAVHRAFDEAQQAVRRLAGSGEAREYATTLSLLAAHRGSVAGDGYVTGGAVGDCAMVVQGDGTAPVSLCRPQRGEYANSTRFLTQADALDRLVFCWLPGSYRHLALLSDGLLELAVNVAANRPFAPFFTPLFAFAAAQEPEHPPARWADAGDGGRTLARVGQPYKKAQAALASFLRSPRVNERTHDDKTLVLVTWSEDAPDHP